MRGMIKRWRMQRAIARHRAQHGGSYSYAGLHFTIDDSVKLDVRHALISGTYEQEEVALARRFLPRMLPVIELGGCLGVVSGVIRSLLDPAQRLIIVEANADLLPMTQANAQRPAPQAPTEIVTAALHYAGPEAVFHKARNAHASRLATLGKVVDAETVKVPAVTLAQLVCKLPPQAPYALVCDVEGAEFDMVAHDAAALAACQVVIIETHPTAFAAQGRSLDSFLSHMATMGLRAVERQSDTFAFVRPS